MPLEREMSDATWETYRTWDVINDSIGRILHCRSKRVANDEIFQG